MKNIHVLPTDKPSELYINMQGDLSKSNSLLLRLKSRNIYITSDEEIKEGDWYFDFNLNKFKKALEVESDRIYYTRHHCTIPTKAKKIILTTDQDLIKDGVQSIPDDFLEWFVNNPSCEEVEVNKICYGALSGFADAGYKIIIPKEETKQTAVEWLAERLESITQNLFEQAKEMEKQQKGYNQEKVFEIERFRAIDFAKWFADFNGLTRDEKRVTKEHLETLYEKYLQTLGGGLLNK